VDLPGITTDASDNTAKAQLVAAKNIVISNQKLNGIFLKIYNLVGCSL